MLLQLLILELALQLLRLHHLTHRPVEIILVNRLSVIFNGKQTTVFLFVSKGLFVDFLIWMNHSRFSDHVSQVSSIQSIAHLDDTFKVNIAIDDNRRGMDLENLQPSDLIR